MSSVQVDISGQEFIQRMERLLAGIPGASDKAAKSAAARAASHLRTNSAKGIRERYDISAAQVKANERVSVRYVLGSGIQAEVKFAGGKIPLFRYGGAGPGAPAYDSSKFIPAMIHGKWRMAHPGVTARGHQLRGTSSTELNNTFVAQMGGGHIGIFERDGNGISEIMGGSVPGMIGSEQVSKKLGQEAAEKFMERYEHDVIARLNGWI